MRFSAIVIDEDVECGRMAADVLSDSYSVRVTNSPDVAFGLMSKREFDVLILEWSPRSKGLIELALRLKRDLMVMITARGRPMVRDVVDCFSVGADDFMRSPYHPSELRARVDRLVRAPKRCEASGPMAVGAAESSQFRSERHPHLRALPGSPPVGAWDV